MTTEIVVKANHGWPVRVTAKHPETGDAINYGGVVPANETRSFHCHSSMDLIVHEIQPNEMQQNGAVGNFQDKPERAESDDGASAADDTDSSE